MISSSINGRRHVATAAASSEPDATPPWASLLGDLVQLIGWRLLETGDLLDYVWLRAVCSHWRSSAASPHGRGIADPRFHPRRWMMLPEGHGLHPGHDKLGGYVRFINLSTGAIVRASLPLFSDHCVFDSSDGLLLLQRDHDTAIRLLHPFTGDIAELPPLLTLVRQFRPQFSPDDRRTRHHWSWFRQVDCTCVSVGADGVVTVMVVFKLIDCLAFATTMDQQWSIAPRNHSRVHMPLSFQGKLYKLDYRSGTIQIVEIEPPRQGDDKGSGSSSPVMPPPRLIATVPKVESRNRKYYLAECDSEILLLGLDASDDPGNSRITVYRVADIIALGKLVPVTSIGDNVLFVSRRILSVSSRFLPNVEGDSVVMVQLKLVDGSSMGRFFGQYQLGSSTWSPAAEESMSSNRVHSACSLVYHIFTCCHSDLWNKGAICFQSKVKCPWKKKRKWRYGVSALQHLIV